MTTFFKVIKTIPEIARGRRTCDVAGASAPKDGRVLGTSCLVELLFFGGAGQRGHAGLAALDDGGDIVEVAGTDFLLVRHEGVTTVTGSEFGLLHALHVSGHTALHVVLRQVEHVVPHGVDASQRDELV